MHFPSLELSYLSFGSTNIFLASFSLGQIIFVSQPVLVCPGGRQIRQLRACNYLKTYLLLGSSPLSYSASIRTEPIFASVSIATNIDKMMATMPSERVALSGPYIGRQNTRTEIRYRMPNLKLRASIPVFGTSRPLCKVPVTAMSSKDTDVPPAKKSFKPSSNSSFLTAAVRDADKRIVEAAKGN